MFGAPITEFLDTVGDQAPEAIEGERRAGPVSAESFPPDVVVGRNCDGRVQVESVSIDGTVHARGCLGWAGGGFVLVRFIAQCVDRPASHADLLFQVISRRYERKRLVLTTNLSFQDWPSIFPNATCATALIDRVTAEGQ